jgi:hypothetical protein
VVEARRITRQRKPGIPGQKSSLGLRVTGEIKQLLDAEAEATGRTQSEQATVCIESYFTRQAQMGGRRTMHLLQACAEIALGMYECEAEWLDDPQRYAEVITTWYETLIEHAPPPPPSLEEKIAAGRDLVVQLLSTRDARLADHLRYLLRTFAKVETFPVEVREEFARAAAFDAFALPPQSEQPWPLSAPPADWVATPATHLDSVMKEARAVLVGRGAARDPDDETLAAFVLADADLRRYGGVPETVRTPEELLRYREALLANPPAAPDRVEEMIARGRRYIAALDPSTPHRTRALRNLLGIYSEDPALPDEVRAEFKAAAEEPPEREQQA